MRLAIYGLAFGLGFGLLAPAAFADPIESITFSGVAGSRSYESTGIFAQSPGFLNGDAFSVTVSYNPAQLVNNNTCKSATDCSFEFVPGSNVSESITVNGITKTYSEIEPSDNTNDFVRFAISGNATSGYTDTIALQIGGNVYELTASLPDGDSTPLFSSETNADNPYLLNNVASQSLTGATFSTAVDSDDPVIIASTGTPLVLTTSNVPEPASLAVLGAGLVALGFVRRRKVSAAGCGLPA